VTFERLSTVAYLGGGGIVPWPPPLADGKFFLKGLKTGGRADGPPPSDGSGLSGPKIGESE
jgi:hypothetical protein